MTNTRPRRFKILYLILLILIAISVVPLWIYGGKMMSINKERLELQENVMQVVLSQSLAQEVSLYIGGVTQQLKELFDAVVPLAVQTPPAKYETDPRLRVSLGAFLTDRPNVLYATVLNIEAKGVQAGAYNAASDAFLRRALEAAFTATRQGEEFRSNPIPIYRNGVNEPVMVIAHPINAKDHFIGMVGAVITLAPVVQRLKDVQQLGLEAYIVDNTGRLVASNNPDRNISGMDMVSDPIVQKFLTWRGQVQATETSPFDMVQNGQSVAMLGTYSSIQSMGWGVIVQRKLSDAYYVVDQMRIETIRWGLVMIILSVVVGAFAAKTITRPIDLLTQAARQIAQHEFTRRADIRSRTEIGELAETFNQMADDIQGYIGDLQRASEENRALFIDSIEMIAAAVDAKDPYTKGHSRRVSQYSVLLAKEMGLDDDEVDKVRISATLHDVGKIGIEDRVLKKPGVLTNEEFEIMKRHTVMGYEIVRQVKQLGEMLPGIRWHHESLNGKGYPDGIKGDEIPLMVRIISVADTFDAITTDRPYQAGSEFPKALEVLRKHAGSKYDPIVVDALHSSYAKGDLAKHETRRSAVISVPQAATTSALRS